MTMSKAGTIVVWLDLDIEPERYSIQSTYLGTKRAVESGRRIVHTTQTHFLQFKYAKKLRVVINGTRHEITLGKCEGTDRLIRKTHNIEKLLLAGEFDWYKEV